MTPLLAGLPGPAGPAPRSGGDRAIRSGKRPIVVAAYQCGPGMGSVSQIGWEWYRRLAARRPVTLVTHVRNRAAIEAAPNAPARRDIIYIDTEWFAGPLYRLAKKLFPHSEHGVFVVSSLDFFLFDRLALRALRERRAEAGWSLIHIVTPVTLAAPSCLHRLGLPVVRGPLNCGLESPPGFPEQVRHEKPWLIKLRELPRVLDGLIGSTRRAALLLTATQATLRAIPARHRARCRTMIENGVAPEHFPAAPWPPAPDSTRPLDILFVGRMIAVKGVDMLLRAVARLHVQGVPLRLTLVGDGPERESWQGLAASLGLADVAHFTGALPASGVAAAMRACHVFCLPSVRESGGAVLLEAMAVGRPVIAVAHGGPAEIVDDEVGRPIPATNPDEVIDRLAAAFADIVAKPEAWAARGERGRRRVENHFGWEGKITQAEALYAPLEAAGAQEFSVTSQSRGA